MRSVQASLALDLATTSLSRREQIEAMHRAMPDFWNLAVQQKLGLPAEWQWFDLRVIGPDVLVRGAVPVGYTRDGRPKWPKVRDSQQCVVTTAERNAARDAWTRRTGLCWNCGGSGEEFASWHHVTGKQFRPCRRCQIATPVTFTPTPQACSYGEVPLATRL